MHVSATATTNVIPGVSDRHVGDGADARGYFEYRFVIHPDENSTGDRVTTRLSFSMSGSASASGIHTPELDAWTEVNGLIGLIGRAPPGAPSDGNLVLDVRFTPSTWLSYNRDGSIQDGGDFDQSNWEAHFGDDEFALGYGYEYIFYVAADVRSGQIYNGEPVPEGGHSLAMLGLSLSIVGIVAQRIKKKSIGHK